MYNVKYKYLEFIQVISVLWTFVLLVLLTFVCIVKNIPHTKSHLNTLRKH